MLHIVWNFRNRAGFHGTKTLHQQGRESHALLLAERRQVSFVRRRCNSYTRAFMEVSLASPGVLASEVILLVSETGPALLCIAALPPGGAARLLCMRRRARYPALKILVGRWGYTGDIDKTRGQYLDVGATQFAATQEETCDQIAAWRPSLADSALRGTRPCRPPPRGKRPSGFVPRRLSG